MIRLYDRVEVVATGVTGIVVDISDSGKYVVEGDTKERRDGAYGGAWPLYDCMVSELRVIEADKAVAYS